MKRRDFSLACGAAVASSALVSTAVLAQGGPVAGKHYQVLSKPAGVEAPAGKIEVVEFFWYNCPHCNTFEPVLEAWSKSLAKDVVLRKVPIAFRADFQPQQRLYYTLEALGLNDQLGSKVFAAIHVEKQKLDTPEQITEWIVKQGVDKAKFLGQFNSFTVANKATKATQLQNAYQIEGVPALGVAGQFLTDGGMAGSMERALQVVDFLAASVRNKR